MFFILAVICIILGFLTAAVNDTFLLTPVAWFIASIAFSLLGGDVSLPWGKRNS